MWIDSLWLLIGLAVIILISHRVGYNKGYDAYDQEIEVMQKKGDVVFPGIEDDR